MGTVSWTEGEGPLVPLASGFRRQLERCGYAPRAVRGHLLVMGQLNRWLVAEGLSAAELIPARVEQFFAARWAAGQRRVPTMQALAPLCTYLRDRHVLAPERPPARTPVEELLAGSAMPPVAGWRDTRLPATMHAADVAALLNGCDRSRPAGLRDVAILSLLGRLGMRSGEVAALQLGDIDWRAGEILVRGKTGRDDRLPLTVEAGEAIAAYLRDGRPPSPCRSVFLTCYAPFRPIHPSSITRVVYRACRRAGLALVGGHRLRHALATEMLRQGGDLVEIGQVLRHRDLATTSVYAKVDRTALRTVAQPWPGAGR